MIKLIILIIVNTKNLFRKRPAAGPVLEVLACSIEDGASAPNYAPTETKGVHYREVNL